MRISRPRFRHRAGRGHIKTFEDRARQALDKLAFIERLSTRTSACGSHGSRTPARRSEADSRNVVVNRAQKLGFSETDGLRRSSTIPASRSSASSTRTSAWLGDNDAKKLLISLLDHAPL